jgi:uncharacterized membrane protein
VAVDFRLLHRLAALGTFAMLIFAGVVDVVQAGCLDARLPSLGFRALTGGIVLGVITGLLGVPIRAATRPEGAASRSRRMHVLLSIVATALLVLVAVWRSSTFDLSASGVPLALELFAMGLLSAAAVRGGAARDRRIAEKDAAERDRVLHAH